MTLNEREQQLLQEFRTIEAYQPGNTAVLMFHADSPEVADAVNVALQDILSAYATPGHGDVISFGLRVADSSAGRAYQHSWLLKALDTHFGIQRYDADGNPLPIFAETDPRARMH